MSLGHPAGPTGIFGPASQGFPAVYIKLRTDLREGDATKHFPVKKGFLSEKGGSNSVKEGLGKDFYRKGYSVKSFGPFTEPSDSEN